MVNVTQILSNIEPGDRQAPSELLPLVYDELHKLAEVRMNSERLDHTLQATALVHEAYLRLVDVDVVPSWDSRGHFFSAAAEAMRRILIEHARAKKSLKRESKFEAIELTNLQDQPQVLSVEELLDLDDLLTKLEGEDPQVAELVRLRVFAGLSNEEAGKILGCSRRTAFRLWQFACAWFEVSLARKS